MQDLINRIEQTQRLRPECLMCACNKYINKYPQDISMSEKADFMQKVFSMFADAPKSTAIPVLVRDIEKLRFRMFGERDDYKEIKRHFNAILLEQSDSFRQRIVKAEDPMKLAMQLALIGNYIDFAAIKNVDEKLLNQMLHQAEEKIFDEKTYLNLRKDLDKGGRLVYFTDNCGEIVLDKLLIEQIKEQYPQLSISVIVRGFDAANDATMEDAVQIGLDQIAAVVGNGNDIMGTWFPEMSYEAAALVKEADVMLAKGQANFETMRHCGLNVYYLFLCKCDMFANMFRVAPLAGMLINELDPENVGDDVRQPEWEAKCLR